MSAVRSKGNRSTEKRFRAYLIREGVKGWKMHPTHIIGKPDLIFPKENLLIFLDGCFWHGCPMCYRQPKTRKKYWENKVDQNRKRDNKIKARLKKQGYSVLRIWEHEIQKDQSKIIRSINSFLKSGIL